MTTKGFSFVEAVSHCPTAHGRRVGFKNAGEMLLWLRKQSVTVKEAAKLTEKELEGKIIVGEFVAKTLPTLTERVQTVVKGAKR